MAKGKKTGGRQIGSRNKRSSGAETLARDILEDPTYLAKLKARAFAGELAPAVETMLFYFLYGKPVDRTALTTQEGDDVTTFPALQVILTQDSLCN